MTSFIKYLITGTLSVAIYISCLHILHAWVGVGPLISNSSAYAFATVFNYLANCHWAFESESTHFASFAKFTTLVAVGFLGNQIFVLSMSKYLNIDVRVAALLFSALWPLASFIAQRTLVFPDGSSSTRSLKRNKRPTVDKESFQTRQTTGRPFSRWDRRR